MSKKRPEIEIRSTDTKEGVEEVIRVPLPDRDNGEMFAIAREMLGGNHLRVICEDKKERLARIPGKMLKKVWIKVGDLLIVKPWEFQDTKADVVFRYTKVQAYNLKKRGLLPEVLELQLEC
ncbi:MAG: translation initiation factor eIF-1A [Thermoplasmata archaeon]|nr:translation initiation factor eIF-1A [Euryarchaeota archaeon]RLF67298.1 MAG: translation initiation factor eIF-1A [Thermoplasmata archaeon]